ncbi:MAG: hypothetical protein AAF725_15800, partial [Acidobacteriota bacterium]
GIAVAAALGAALHKNAAAPPPRAATTDARLAVLPATNLDGEASLDRWGDGLTEAMVFALSRANRMRVVPQTTLSQLVVEGRGLEESGIDLALETSLGRAGENVRISLKLVDVGGDEYLWLRDFEVEIPRGAIEIRLLGEHVADALMPAIFQNLQTLDRGLLSPDPRAKRAFYQGRERFWQDRQQANLEAQDLFREAIELDPDFALARAYLAKALALEMLRYGAPEETFDLAMHQAREALAIEPNLPEAHKAMGLAYSATHRMAMAQGAYEAALGAWPNYDEALSDLAVTLLRRGRWDRGIEVQSRRARFSASSRATMALGLHWLGLNEEAAKWCEFILRRDSEYPLVQRILAQQAILEGRHGEARDRLERYLARNPRCVECLLVAGENEIFAGDPEAAVVFARRAVEQAPDLGPSRLMLAKSLWLSGERRESSELLAKLESEALSMLENSADNPRFPWRLATLAALRGDVETAVAHYEVAVQLGHRWVERDLADPIFAPLREDPRFLRLAAGVERQVADMRSRVVAHDWEGAAYRCHAATRGGNPGASTAEASPAEGSESDRRES